jgi:hypothetical protein
MTALNHTLTDVPVNFADYRALDLIWEYLSAGGGPTIGYYQQGDTVRVNKIDGDWARTIRGGWVKLAEIKLG